MSRWERRWGEERGGGRIEGGQGRECKGMEKGRRRGNDESGCKGGGGGMLREELRVAHDVIGLPEELAQDVHRRPRAHLRRRRQRRREAIRTIESHRHTADERALSEAARSNHDQPGAIRGHGGQEGFIAANESTESPHLGASAPLTSLTGDRPFNQKQPAIRCNQMQSPR